MALNVACCNLRPGSVISRSRRCRRKEKFALEFWANYGKRYELDGVGWYDFNNSFAERYRHARPESSLSPGSAYTSVYSKMVKFHRFDGPRPRPWSVPFASIRRKPNANELFQGYKLFEIGEVNFVKEGTATFTRIKGEMKWFRVFL